MEKNEKFHSAQNKRVC